MTEQWKPEEIPKKVEGLLEALLQSAVLESDARLKVGTPVRFANSLTAEEKKVRKANSRSNS